MTAVIGKLYRRPADSRAGGTVRQEPAAVRFAVIAVAVAFLTVFLVLPLVTRRRESGSD